MDKLDKQIIETKIENIEESLIEVYAYLISKSNPFIVSSATELIIKGLTEYKRIVRD